MKSALLESIDRLNDKQKQAVLTTQGPLLIAAGAGSGKTRVLTHRIAYLIEQENVNPWNILAITFTNKAANEMRERVQALVGPQADSIWVATFHAMCARILRRECEILGYQKNFSIIDTGQQQTLMKQVLKDLNLDSKRYNYKEFLAMIDEAKNKCLTPKAYSQEAEGYLADIQAHVYKSYQEQLIKNNAMDFNDLIMLTVRLFQEHEEVLQFYQNKFQYIHVDEYQDTNHSQYQLIQLLTGLLGNICVVGDADQSIYGWRGANMENILNFEQDYPNAQVILLEQNYRSTQNILNAANSVISNNIHRKEKKLWSDKKAGEKVKFFLAETDIDEARFVIQQIIEAKENYKLSNNEFAILYRTQAQSRNLEDQLLKMNMSYKIIGGLKFYARKEIQDTLAYLKLIDNGTDNLAFNRIINVPKRGLGQASIDNLAEFAESLSLSMFEAIEHLHNSNLPSRSKQKFQDFYAMIIQLRKQAQFLNVSELVKEVWEETEYIKSLKEEGSIEASNRIENLEEFASVTKQFDELDDKELETDPDYLVQDGQVEITEAHPRPRLTFFLEELSLATDREEMDQEDQITLMTMHAAKGLEFPYVFIVGLEEGLFPLRRASESEEELEEERRLAYVGMTRAEKVLYLTASKSRLLYGRYQHNLISRFIDEVDSDYLERLSVYQHSVKFDHPKSRSTGYQQASRVVLPNQRPRSKSQKRPVTRNEGDIINWQIGDLVNHKAWGQGTVVQVTDSGGDQLLAIEFPSQSLKQVLAKFAPIEKVD